MHTCFYTEIVGPLKWGAGSFIFLWFCFNISVQLCLVRWSVELLVCVFVDHIRCISPARLQACWLWLAENVGQRNGSPQNSAYPSPPHFQSPASTSFHNPSAPCVQPSPHGFSPSAHVLALSYFPKYPVLSTAPHPHPVSLTLAKFSAYLFDPQ